ncbi:hypothetical protein [Ureibacillus aquaedulcis]|uniref:Coupling factor for flagellin transcription and translation n=1 Tax=Ureibacillus aquaedulcis TaxID=3058421 RepID=A0ABT8GS88_9BACL|nr:hypothetical protein [Ureibacillus sp. BA0131]MDN4494271.1 hypothetical protein [Ureibacillus sp. BA0131]
MVVSLVIILVISQLICFYFLVILNTRIAKFKDLEKRQDQLIREMDDAISLYLVEMKEENDRLIAELSSIKQIENKNKEIKDQKAAMMNLDDVQANSGEAQEESLRNSHPAENGAPKVTIPKRMATNAYKQHSLANENSTPRKQAVEEEVEKDLQALPSFEQKVLNLHKQGKTIDEIAKLTQKGKTEIELLIKFHA